MERVHIPEKIRNNIEYVVDCLLKNGIGYQKKIINERGNDPYYAFLFPQSQYYRYYINKLAQKTSHNKHKSIEKQITYSIEGNLQDMSVGGMCQIIKDALKQGHQTYQPLNNQLYAHQITKVINHIELQKKVNDVLKHITQIANKQQKNSEIKSITTDKNTVNLTKRDQMRLQMGAGKDGSLGFWGGKKYEGLGSRDAYSQFRRQKSQMYHQKMQDKRKI